eukprot:5550017-Prymnesium_polylepis.1
MPPRYPTALLSPRYPTALLSPRYPTALLSAAHPADPLERTTRRRPRALAAADNPNELHAH